jgi:hypothetical protein
MSRFARFLDALYESRMRQAARVVREHSHFRAEAEDYGRRRDKMMAEETAEARSQETAQPGMRLAPGSAS